MSKCLVKRTLILVTVYQFQGTTYFHRETTPHETSLGSHRPRCLSLHFEAIFATKFHGGKIFSFLVQPARITGEKFRSSCGCPTRRELIHRPSRDKFTAERLVVGSRVSMPRENSRWDAFLTAVHTTKRALVDEAQKKNREYRCLFILSFPKLRLNISSYKLFSHHFYLCALVTSELFSGSSNDIARIIWLDGPWNQLCFFRTFVSADFFSIKCIKFGTIWFFSLEVRKSPTTPDKVILPPWDVKLLGISWSFSTAESRHSEKQSSKVSAKRARKDRIIVHLLNERIARQRFITRSKTR